MKYKLGDKVVVHGVASIVCYINAETAFVSPLENGEGFNKHAVRWHIQGCVFAKISKEGQVTLI